MTDSIGMVPVLSLRLIQESIQRTKLSNNRGRKAEAAKRLDYYAGDQLEHLKTVLSAQFAHPERLRLQAEFSNIVKSIIDQVSVVYKKPAQRKLMINGELASDEIQERYVEMTKSARLDAILKKVNRYTNLLNTVGVQAQFRNGRLELDIHTPDVINVVQDPQDPTAATAVIIEQSFADTISMDSHSNPFGGSKLFIVWTADGHMVFNESGVAFPELANDEGVNPFGRIPIAWFRDQWPDGNFWNEGTFDLMIAQESLNVKLTELNNLLKMQSFSIPVIIGDAPKGGITIDPSNYISIPLGDSTENGRPDFKFVSPDPKISEIIEAIQDGVSRISRDWGISPEQFRLTGSPTSGFALEMQNIRLIERREDDVDLYQAWEEDLFDVMRVVWNSNVEVGKRIPLDATLAINFAELDFPADPAAEDARWELQIKNGLRNRAQWIMTIDSDLKTEEDAIAAIQHNREVNEQTAGKGLVGLEEGLANALNVKPEDEDEEDEEEGDENTGAN